MIECGRQSLLHRRRRMMTDANLENVLDESHELISSARVEGTHVFNPQGEKLGSGHSVMIHKNTGQVAYAVLSFGDRKSAVQGTSVSVRVDLGGRRIIKKKKN